MGAYSKIFQKVIHNAKVIEEPLIDADERLCVDRPA